MDRSDQAPQRLFARILEIEPDWAALLVTNGLTTLEEVAYIPIDEFRSIDGLDEQQIQTWRLRARRHLAQAVGGDDEDPLVVTTESPNKPIPGGSGATPDDETR